MNTEKSPKKRSRMSTSCSVCRKRKSKCDRQRPVCGTCKKKSIAHLCSYDDDFHAPANQFVSPMLPQNHLQNPSQPYMSVPRHPLMQMGAHPPPAHAPAHAHTFQSPAPAHAPISHPAMMPVYSANGSWAHPPQSHFDYVGQQPQNPSQMALQVHNIPPQQHQQHQQSQQHQLHQQQPPVQVSPQSAQPAASTQASASLEYPTVTERSHSQRTSLNSNFSSDYNPDITSGPVVNGFQNQIQPNAQSPHIISERNSGQDVSTHVSSTAKQVAVTEASPTISSSSFPKDPKPLSPASNRTDINSVPSSFGTIASKVDVSPAKSSGSFSMPPPVDSASTSSSPKAILNSTKTDQAPSESGDTAMSSVKSDNTYISPQKRTYSQHLDEQDDDMNHVSIFIGSKVLKIAVDDIMDAFSSASSTLLVEGTHWQQQGPLSYVGLTKRDQFFKLIRNFTVRLFRSEQFSRFIPKNQKKASDLNHSSKDENSNEITTDMTSDDPDSEEDVLVEDTLITTKIHANENKSSNQNSIEPGFPIPIPGLGPLLTYNNSKKVFYKFVEQNVLQILPQKGAITEALNKYFQYVHPFVPIFDETSFLKEIKVVFRKNQDIANHEYYKKLSIRNDTQLNLLAQLLLFIRLGYMCLIPTNETDTTYSKIEQVLIKDITRLKSDHYLNVVNLCIPEDRVQTKSTFKMVQSLTLLHFYRSVAPNDCLGLSGSDSQLLHGAIVGHAMSIGLNRDPSEYDTILTISKEPVFVNTWRALWTYIVNLDAMNSIYCGTALKIPHVAISDVHAAQVAATEETNHFFKYVYEVCSGYRRIVNKITNLDANVRVIDLLLETSKLEKIFLEIFGKDFFRDYIRGSSPNDVYANDSSKRGGNEQTTLKVLRFLLFINIRANLSCLYYLVVVHFEKKLDKEPNADAGPGIELFKIFTRSVVQLVYIMTYVLDNMQELFGKHYDYILTSRIERAMIKTHTFFSAFFIRLVNYKRTLAIKETTGEALTSSNNEDFDERCTVVDSFFIMILIEAELFIGHFKNLSNTYLSSYKLYVMAFFVLKQCMENPEILLAGITNSEESLFNDDTNIIQFVSNEQLESLYKLCEEFRLAKLESVRRQNKHKSVSSSTTNDVEAKQEDDGKPLVTAEEEEAKTNDKFDVSEKDASAVLQDEFYSQAVSGLDATLANRAMYTTGDTVNTYGALREKHTHPDFEGEVFDEQNMIGNDELLKLFNTYGML